MRTHHRGYSGIGEAFANRLAQKGFNLILHGRRQEKLTEVPKIWRKTYNISVKSSLENSPKLKN